MAVERTSGKVQLTLVWNEENYRDATPKLQLLAKDLRSRQPDLFHSIWVNFRYRQFNGSVRGTLFRESSQHEFDIKMRISLQISLRIRTPRVVQ